MKKPILHDAPPPARPPLSAMAVAALLYSLLTSPMVLWPLAYRTVGRNDWRFMLFALLFLPLSASAAGLIARRDVSRSEFLGRPVRGRLLAWAAFCIGLLAFLVTSGILSLLALSAPIG